MDSLITAAGRALAAGDPLGALSRVALRDDAPALALRGIAMAQLGDLARARTLLRRAARAFGPREAVARARCVVAEAEVALASRDLRAPVAALAAARATLDAHGDGANAAHARCLEIRRLLLIGRLDDVERALASFDPSLLPAASRAVHALVAAGVAVRRVRTQEARTALATAARAARQAGIAALIGEVELAARVLEAPVARLLSRGGDGNVEGTVESGVDGGGRDGVDGRSLEGADRGGRLLRLDEVEAILDSGDLVVDAGRHVVRKAAVVVKLATRPVPFALARALAEAWPADVPRDALIRGVFGARHADESHRARLRVEAGRLRRELKPVAQVRATARGYRIEPRGGARVIVLAPTEDGAHAQLLALLADGESWSSSALAMALAASQRTIQRALEQLAAERRIEATGRGRSRRWQVAPLSGFATPLLLPAWTPGG